MPENDSPLSALLTRNDSSDAVDGKKKPKAKKDEVLPEIPEAPPEVSARFPVGARIRYLGSKRLFAGWEANPILAPMMDYTVEQVIGEYSIIVAKIDGDRYPLMISPASKADWETIG